MKRTPDDIYDELLVIRVQSGERDALTELFERWKPRLHRYIRRLTDATAISDVMQETWLAIARGLHRLDDPAKFRAWVYRLAGHKCADAVRERRRERAHLSTEQTHDRTEGVATRVPDADRSFEQSENVAELRDAINRLPLNDQAMLHLRYVEEMSIPMIAEVLDRPEGTIKSRLHTLRQELKNLLEPEPASSERSV